MHVLFVVGGNSRHFDIAPFIKAQGESLQQRGIELSYFKVSGRGFWNYVRNSRRLRRFVKNNPIDLLHAHYTLSGWVAVLAFCGKPIVLSLMGSDAMGDYSARGKLILKSRLYILLTYLIQPFVQAIISKSEQIEAAVFRKKISHRIPNGVRFDIFRPSASKCYQQLNLDPLKQYVLFLGDPENVNKNYALAREAVELLNQNDVVLLNLYNADAHSVAKFLNTVDVFVLCSFAEGSANVLKEAMACNCPIVSTTAGDAAWVLGNTAGCFLSDYNPVNFAGDLKKALDFAAGGNRTNGRDRLLNLELEASQVARRIEAIYTDLI